jgi:transposase
MEEYITIPRSEYEGMKREIAELRSIVRQLEEIIALLKGGKNSRTSSTASSQDIGRSNSHSLRTPSDKKPGGQPGHAGHSLQMNETPNKIIDHPPLYCTHCNADLQEVSAQSYTCRQLVDVPPLVPIYTEHCSHIKIWPCCGVENRGVFSERMCSPIQYGEGIEVTVGYLPGYQYLSYKRIAQFFKDCFWVTSVGRFHPLLLIRFYNV